MRYLTFVLVVLFFLLQCNIAAAACEWSKDVKKLSNGNYSYTKDCHLEVGKSLEKLDKKQEQVKKLNKAIELKDLVITTNEKRIENWKQLSIDLEDRVNTIEALKGPDKLIWFSIGVIVTGLAVHGAGQLK